MCKDKIQITNAPYSAHDVDVKGFFTLNKFSNLPQKGDMGCKVAVDASSEIRNLHSQLEGPKAKLNDEFGIGSGVDGIAAYTLHGHGNDVATKMLPRKSVTGCASRCSLLEEFSNFLVNRVCEVTGSHGGQRLLCSTIWIRNEAGGRG